LYTRCLKIRRGLTVSHLCLNNWTLLTTLFLLALRSFTLESGQEEIERLNRRRKERSNDLGDFTDSRRGSVESIRSPTVTYLRAPSLSDVPEEEGTFAVGDDEDDEDDETEGERPTPVESRPTEQPSRASSISSNVDDAVPTQLRGMSEKARGKMPGKLLSKLTLALH
jgi:hypothetical protein